MFQNHQTKISQAAISDKSGKMLGKVMTMVILSIQQPWFNIENMMLDVEHIGIESKYLWGMKHDAYKYILRNRKDIHKSFLSYLDYRRPFRSG